MVIDDGSGGTTTAGPFSAIAKAVNDDLLLRRRHDRVLRRRRHRVRHPGELARRGQLRPVHQRPGRDRPEPAVDHAVRSRLRHGRRARPDRRRSVQPRSQQRGRLPGRPRHAQPQRELHGPIGDRRLQLLPRRAGGRWPAAALRRAGIRRFRRRRRGRRRGQLPVLRKRGPGGHGRHRGRLGAGWHRRRLSVWRRERRWKHHAGRRGDPAAFAAPAARRDADSCPSCATSGAQAPNARWPTP
ncbi:MAG: hypothetical protein MZV64_72365 [Ignavibacteriales bacterium]|nr:hypothetical protein [Ignavibacteriales bacterium]